MQRNKLNCACGWWQEGKCTRFSSDFEDYAQYKDCREDKYTCDQYEPLYNQENIAYILNVIYKQSKKYCDRAILDDMHIAGHCCDFIGDYLYWTWPINVYVLMLRNSRLVKKIDKESQINAFELMKPYGFKITKRMKRKYKRLKKQFKDRNMLIRSYIEDANSHLNGV